MMEIEIKDMEFYAFHGCYDTERRVGNRFLVTVRMEADVAAAAANDDLSATVNYVEVYDIVRRQMEIPSRIIENVAHRIIGALSEAFPQLENIAVKVSKLHPPIGGKVEKTSVTLKA